MWEISSPLTGDTEANGRGTEEALLIRHVHPWVQTAAEEGRGVFLCLRFGRTQIFLLDDRCRASRPADITQRNPYSPLNAPSGSRLVPVPLSQS